MSVRRPAKVPRKERLNLYLPTELLTRVQAAGVLLGIESDGATVRHLLLCALEGLPYAEPEQRAVREMMGLAV